MFVLATKSRRMIMRKVFFYILTVLLLYACGSNDQGELVGVRSKTKWHSLKPLGMTLVPGGSFTIGSQDEDITGSMATPSRTVTVRSFYMDETEITNAEYKEFVHWVRDSIVRTELALMSELMSDDGTTVLEPYQFKDSDTANMTPYQKYMMDSYGSLGDVNAPLQGRSLDWTEELIWDFDDFPDECYAEVMDSMYTFVEGSYGGRRTLDVKKLRYRYPWYDVGKQKNQKRPVTVKDTVFSIYPDTAVWLRDFNYSYNDPMHQDYFSHQAYQDYPVLGISWDQARAFCHWRTKRKNDYLATKKRKTTVPDFRLPTEAEWEYAARGGLENPTYPWGGPYTSNDRGCFLANFKPQRGDYALDGALYTVEAKSYNPNDYGLYNMAGNVSEWTDTEYVAESYRMGATLNPSVRDGKNRKKVIRGGSWKDVAYFLRVSTRDYEYADSTRSYIGFRTVQDVLGTVKK